MIKYRPFEMHTHTFNSDGRFTLNQLTAAAADYGFEGIALTDHNTMSGFDGLPEVPVVNGIPVIRGIEWTTFFGHILVLYPDRFIDWRWATPDTIDSYFAQIREADGIIGIAHPFEVGSPLCTGCHFDFNVRDWNNVDYIEVWSKENPTRRFETPLALELWTGLLNRGYHIAVTAGRDWHWETGKKHSAATYLGLRDGIVSPDTVREALRCGRTYLSCGPRMDITVRQNGRDFTMGETLQPGSCRLVLHLDREERRKAWDGFGIIPRELRIVMNGKTVTAADCAEGDDFTFDLDAEKGWFRLEMWGDALGDPDRQLGLSGAFYVNPE
ncbi:MAG: CehA/McbA family metallohydrolase [Flexilinea sp.]|nr:CehA/McbA family metallohydrolase [Flexilinea sp.]